MVQTEFSGFFNGRTYDEDTLVELFATILSDGIYSTEGTHLEVTADGLGMTVSVALDSALNVARAIIRGRWYKLIAAKALTIGTADATNDRIDRIILRLDKTSTADSPIQLMVLQGTAAETPTAPDISRSGNIWDLSLAQVYVTAGVSVIASDKVTDERADTDLCGPYHAANQQNIIDTWFATVSSEWADWFATVPDTNVVADNLLQNLVENGVTTTYGTVVSVSDDWTSDSTYETSTYEFDYYGLVYLDYLLYVSSSAGRGAYAKLYDEEDNELVSKSGDSSGLFYAGKVKPGYYIIVGALGDNEYNTITCASATVSGNRMI